MDSYQIVFPAQEYLVQKGSGKTPEEAINESSNSIAQYISTQISSSVNTLYKSETENKNGSIEITEVKQNSREILLTSDVNLRGVEFTQPFYEKSKKEWICVCYINRENAFELYKSEIDTKKQNFYAIYNKVESETDVFNKIKYLSTALNTGNEFYKLTNFVRLISPEQIRIEYENDLKLLDSLESKIVELKIKTPIYISVQNDSSNIVYGTIAEVLNRLQFTTTSNSESSKYQVKALVNSNLISQFLSEDQIIAFNPDLILDIEGLSGSVFSYSISTDLVKGYNLMKIGNKACKNISEKIATDLYEELSAYLSGNNKK